MSVDFESLENKYHTIYLEKQDAVTKNKHKDIILNIEKSTITRVKLKTYLKI